MGRIGVLEVLASGALGGGATHVAALATGLDPERFDVHVACSDDGPLLAELAAAEVAVHRVNLTGRFNLGTARALVELVGAHGLQIVHFHGTRSGFAGLMAARRAGVAAVYTVHGWACHAGRDPVSQLVARTLESGIAHACDTVVCVSHGDLAAGLRQGIVNPARARVIANGVDPERSAGPSRRAAQRAELGLLPSERAVGLVGRLTVQKGQRLLLAAAPRILAAHPDAVFVLIGEGPERSGLESLAAQLGVRDRVRFVGARRDVPDLVGALDLFVLPSLWEGMPISLLEAMAAGVPVVASSVHGSSEVVEDGQTGLLVKVGDVDQLGMAIDRLLSDPFLAARLGEAARRTVREGYHVRDMVGAVAALYEALVAARGLRTGVRR